MEPEMAGTHKETLKTFFWLQVTKPTQAYWSKKDFVRHLLMSDKTEGSQPWEGRAVRFRGPLCVPQLLFAALPLTLTAAHGSGTDKGAALPDHQSRPCPNPDFPYSHPQPISC